MTEKRKTLFTDLGIGFAVAVSMIVMNWNSGFPLSHIFCDGFFAAGVLLLGSGALIFCGNHGAFDMMSYGLKSVVGLVVRSFEPDTDYYTYSQQKAEVQKPFGHLMIAGLIYLALAAICLVVYQMTA